MVCLYNNNMFWKKKPLPKKKKTDYSKHPLIKPSPRKHMPREKRIEIKMPCYLLVEKTGYCIQTTTINVSKSGILVKSLRDLEHGQEVLCLLSDKTNLGKLHVLGSQHTMKGKIVRLEREEVLYKIAIQVTFGRVNPMAYLESMSDGKFWWTRHWQ
jgi:hypothetical protein